MSRKAYQMKDTTNIEDWRKEFRKWEKHNLPFPPPLKVIPEKQTPYDKKMAKLTEKLINYTFSEANSSKMIKTPWGVLMWTPKKKD